MTVEHQTSYSAAAFAHLLRQLEIAGAERDNYRRALLAMVNGTRDHDRRGLEDDLLIRRSAYAIGQEVLRGGTLDDQGVLRSAPPAPAAEPAP